MKIAALFGFVLLLSSVGQAQVAKITNPDLQISQRQQNRPQSAADDLKGGDFSRSYAEDVNNNPVVKFTRRYMKNSGNQKSARNLMVVQAVAEYKLDDEQLKSEVEALESNQEYHKKLDKIMKNLSNKKMRNNKNKQAMRILDDAGEKLYKLLAN